MQIENIEHALLNNSLVGVLMVKNRIIQGINSRLAEMLGLHPGELIGLPSRILYADDKEWARGGESYALFQTQKEVKIPSVRMLRKDDKVIIADFSGVVLPGKEGLSVWTIVDVTQRELQKRQLEELSNINEALLSSTTAGITVLRYPERIIERVNFRMLEIYGASSEEELVGSSSRIFLPDKEVYERVGALGREIMENGKGILRDVPFRRIDNGTIVYTDLSGQLLDLKDGAEHIIWTLVNVSERYQLAIELDRQAHFDALTELPNRRSLDEELEKAIARANRHKATLSVVMMDLDGFKPVNDIYGHEAGDIVLKTIGRRLREGLRRTDFVARLGGDEFVLLLEDCAGADDINNAMNKIGEIVGMPIGLPDAKSVNVGLSAGICAYHSGDAEKPDGLLRRADQALYKSKEHKADRPRFWTASD